MLRPYEPSRDAQRTFELGKRLFKYSRFFHVEELEDFTNHYRGWVIEDCGEIIAFLVYSREFAVDSWAWYIDFVASTQPGCGQRLMDTFLQFIENQHALAFLHVELDAISPSRASRLMRWYERNGFRMHEPILGPLESYMLPMTQTMVRVNNSI